MAVLLNTKAKWIGPARARGRLYALEGYPGFVPDSAESWIAGDLFSILPGQIEAVLPVLDAYEECSASFPQPHEYVRAVVDILCQGETLPDWTYVYAWPTIDLLRVESGDWLVGPS